MRWTVCWVAGAFVLGTTVLGCGADVEPADGLSVPAEVALDGEAGAGAGSGCGCGSWLLFAISSVMPILQQYGCQRRVGRGGLGWGPGGSTNASETPVPSYICEFRVSGWLLFVLERECDHCERRDRDCHNGSAGLPGV